MHTTHTHTHTGNFVSTERAATVRKLLTYARARRGAWIGWVGVKLFTYAYSRTPNVIQNQPLRITLFRGIHIFEIMWKFAQAPTHTYVGDTTLFV